MNILKIIGLVFSFPLVWIIIYIYGLLLVIQKCITDMMRDVFSRFLIFIVDVIICPFAILWQVILGIFTSAYMSYIFLVQIFWKRKNNNENYYKMFIEE